MVDVGACVGGMVVRDVAVGGRVGARRAVMVSWKRRRGWAIRDMAGIYCVCCPSVFLVCYVCVLEEDESVGWESFEGLVL
jgi:hypothetical protein